MAYIDKLFEEGNIEGLKRELEKVNEIIRREEARLVLAFGTEYQKILDNLEYEKSNRARILRYIAELSDQVNTDLQKTFEDTV